MLPWAVVLEHVEEAVPAQLVHQRVLVLKFEFNLKTLIMLFWKTDAFLYTFAGGNAPVTRVTKEMFSDLRISQQCLRAETEDSLVLRAEEERACILKGKQNGGYNGPVV